MCGVERWGVDAREEGESQAGRRTSAARLEHLHFSLKAVTVLSGVICSKQSQCVYTHIFKLRLTLQSFLDVAGGNQR